MHSGDVYTYTYSVYTAVRWCTENMAGLGDGEERTAKATVRNFLDNHIKTSVTVLMICGTLMCIILIVQG